MIRMYGLAMIRMYGKEVLNSWTAKSSSLVVKNPRRCCAPKETKALRLWHSRCFLTTSTFATGGSEVNMADGMKQDWRELCLAVTNESDPTKLGSLVQQLIEALEEGERSWRQLTRSQDVQNAA